jgi:alanine racemase
MQYTIQQIAEITGGVFLNQPVVDVTINRLLLDSRQVIFPETSLFIALQGRRHDGHAFLEDLCQGGVRNFLVSKKTDVSAFSGANFILVKNTHEAFHQLARHHRHRFSLPVIGITGSNGKTIVKEWLYQLLHEDYHVVRSPRSYNSQTGVPLSVLQIATEHTLGIFEAGISQMGEMEKLATLIEPTIGIFTNIGEAHSEGFPDMETKLRQKLLLFQTAKTVIYCRDDERIHRAMEEILPPERRFTWSLKAAEADLQISKIQSLTTQTLLQIPNSKSQILLPFTDPASLENALHCLALMTHLGYDAATVARRLQKLEPVAMRLELKEGVNRCTLINDSYNSDLTSLSLALNFLEQQSKTPRRSVILSDILQSGQSPGQLYGAVANLLKEKRIGRFIGIGETVRVLEKKLPAGIEAHFFPDTNAFLEKLPLLDFRDETVLLKGARRFQFERIADRLAVKVHKTTLEVNLGALLHNLRTYQGQLQPGVKLMAMVKAGAYGSGSAEVAKLLEFQHVDYLGVAYADEGVALRNENIRLPIMVMNPEEATFDLLVRYNLEPEIYSLSLFEKFIRFTRSSDRSCPAIHLKLDTGMHRLGFVEEDLDTVVEWLKANPDLQVSTVFSHLAASESPAQDDFTRQQGERFTAMYEFIAAGLDYRPLRHILNSSGIVRFPEWQMDMVRLGIGLYGVDGSGLLQQQLQTVNTLKATISQIKKIAPGETVGYGRMGKATQAMRIATLSIGYADGLLRRAGNGRFSVVIREKKAPLFGNVCMDMVMCDVTRIPEAQEGDAVIIFGKELPVEELATCLGTIPYEIFTTISERVKRVYVQE